MESAAEVELDYSLYWAFWYIASWRWLKPLLMIILVILNNFYAIPINFVFLLVLSPLYLTRKSLYRKVESKLYGWLLTMVASWAELSGYNLLESGHCLDSFLQETILFMPNHQSTADVPLCMALFSCRPGYADRVMWIMDNLFKFTNFGACAYVHGDFFILSGKENRERSLVMLKSKLSSGFVQKKRKCLVLFPEGGFLEKRKAISHRYAERHGLPKFEFVTLPRTGALEVILYVLVGDDTSGNGRLNASALHNDCSSQSKIGVDFDGSDFHRKLVKNDKVSSSVDREKRSPTAKEIKNDNNLSESSNLSESVPWLGLSSGYKEKLTKVVDVTIAYPKKGKPLHLIDILSSWSPPCNVHIHYRVFDVSELPKDTEGLKRWTVNLYSEKEAMLEEYYTKGEFPYKKFDPLAHAPTKVRLNRQRVIFIHSFYLVSTLIFVCMFVAPLIYARNFS